MGLELTFAEATILRWARFQRTRPDKVVDFTQWSDNQDAMCRAYLSCLQRSLIERDRLDQSTTVTVTTLHGERALNAYYMNRIRRKRNPVQ
jgi:hypothetical protein